MKKYSSINYVSIILSILSIGISTYIFYLKYNNIVNIQFYCNFEKDMLHEVLKMHYDHLLVTISIFAGVFGLVIPFATYFFQKSDIKDKIEKIDNLYTLLEEKNNKINEAIYNSFYQLNLTIYEKLLKEVTHDHSWIFFETMLKFIHFVHNSYPEKEKELLLDYAEKGEDINKCKNFINYIKTFANKHNRSVLKFIEEKSQKEYQKFKEVYKVLFESPPVVK